MDFGGVKCLETKHVTVGATLVIVVDSGIAFAGFSRVDNNIWQLFETAKREETQFIGSSPNPKRMRKRTFYFTESRFETMGTNITKSKHVRT